MASNLTTVTIYDFQVSFIWFETQLSLLGDTVPNSTTVPFSFLGRFNSYEQKFNAVMQNSDTATKLKLPWQSTSQDRKNSPWQELKKAKHFFWYYYLEKKEGEDVTAKMAWRAFVPFRGTVPYVLKAPWLPKGRFFLEAYYYPHGLALAANARCKGNFTLKEAADLAFKVRKYEQFEVELDGKTLGKYSLDELADMALKLLRQQAWGKDATDSPPNDPFTIFTVIQGEGVDPRMPINEQVQRTLYAVTSWSDTYDYDTLTDLEKANLLIIRQTPPNPPPDRRNPPPSHVLYANRRGRAVWYPATFDKQQQQMRKKLSALACYHRNMIFSVLQVESLYGLVSEGEKLIPNGTLSLEMREALKWAVDILGRLYGGAQTYRSWSTRAHLDMDEEKKQAVNKVRKFWFDKDALF